MAILDQSNGGDVVHEDPVAFFRTVFQFLGKVQGVQHSVDGLAQVGNFVAPRAMQAGRSVSAAGDGSDTCAQFAEAGNHDFFEQEHDYDCKNGRRDPERRNEIQLAGQALPVHSPGYVGLQNQCRFSVNVVEQGIAAQSGVADGADVDVALFR